MINHYQKKHILITGASGYIGSHLVDALSSIDCHIIRLSRKKLLPKNDCIATIEDAQADLTEFNDWHPLIADVDYIFHLAAQTGVKVADASPVSDAQVNIMSLLKILEAARHSGNKKLILAGTATECGIQASLMVDDNAIDAPATLYDLNKFIAEKYVHYFSEKNWIRGTCLRLANVYGSGAQSSDSSRGVLNQVIRNALAGKEIVTFGGGEFIRDYVHVFDVIEAFLLAGAHISTLSQPHYLIGSGKGTTVKAAFDLVATCVEKKTGVTVKQSDIPLPKDLAPIDCRHFIADCSAFSRATGWKARYSLQQGINETIEKSHEEIHL